MHGNVGKKYQERGRREGCIEIDYRGMCGMKSRKCLIRTSEKINDEKQANFRHKNVVYERVFNLNNLH